MSKLIFHSGIEQSQGFFAFLLTGDKSYCSCVISNKKTLCKLTKSLNSALIGVSQMLLSRGFQLNPNKGCQSVVFEDRITSFGNLNDGEMFIWLFQDFVGDCSPGQKPIFVSDSLTPFSDITDSGLTFISADDIFQNIFADSNLYSLLTNDEKLFIQSFYKKNLGVIQSDFFLPFLRKERIYAELDLEERSINVNSFFDFVNWRKQ